MLQGSEAAVRISSPSFAMPVYGIVALSVQDEVLYGS